MPHMTKCIVYLFAAIPFTAIAQWQADQYSGRGDALSMVLFFYAFLVYVIVRDGFKVSRTKGWTSLAACIFVGWLIATFKWALVLACLVFLVSFLQFCWEKLK